MKKLTSILLVLSLCTSLYGCSRMGTNIYNGLNNKRLETKSTGLDNTCINWFFIPNNESRTPDINDKLNFKLSDYDAIYNGPKSPNVKSLYLTFDEGYENGYTEQILDVLKEKNVKAIFFVTSHYITYSPDTVKRMVDEGHIVANHTNHHYSMPSVTYSTDVFNKELTDVEDKFKELTGKDIGIPSLEKAKVQLYEFSTQEFSMTPTELTSKYNQVPLEELVKMLVALL